MWFSRSCLTRLPLREEMTNYRGRQVPTNFLASADEFQTG
jgi:hypothetical protein